jgi:hypothetical protein
MATYNVNKSLTDPSELKENYPNTPVILPYFLGGLSVGNYVKIRRNQEYFWVEVKEFDGETITGEVYYELNINKQFHGGDLLIFKKSFCFDAYDPQVFNLIPNIHLVNS